MVAVFPQEYGGQTAFLKYHHAYFNSALKNLAQDSKSDVNIEIETIETCHLNNNKTEYKGNVESLHLALIKAIGNIKNTPK